ncbi:esterase family protein [Pseudonocardia sp. ICBG1293]|uniref:alpha/beta hydrolase n=1 Tax=Pseudonocardia sp. ICBG1293 TaxID=2844382 RepID=UPI001CC955F3|nr:alpha/beta hydrolase-fold protein [Pseudonocardia sp. ICBG1293]
MIHASELRLDVAAAPVVLAATALVLLVGTGGAWHRVRRTGRSLLAVASAVVVLAACGAGANLLGGFFPTVGSLIGSSPDPGEGTAADIGPDGAGLDAVMPLVAARSAHGLGTTLHMTLHGAASGIDRDADVHLPPGYTEHPGYRFPVVEWLPGFPGEPREVAALFRVPDVLDAAIAAHRVPPVVVVIPDINGEPRFGHDQECVDAQHGAHDDTYLTTDLVGWTMQHLRVRTDRGAWALAGWSSGGYCAMNLALRHPRTYALAVSQSGYDRTPDDVVTGELFAGRPDLAAANDVVALLRGRPAPLAMLVTAGTDEPDERAAADRIRAAATPPVTVDTRVYPGGGHNQNAVRAQLPDLVDWLGAHLPGPLVPSAAPAGVTVDDGPGVPQRVLPVPDP